MTARSRSWQRRAPLALLGVAAGASLLMAVAAPAGPGVAHAGSAAPTASPAADPAAGPTTGPTTGPAAGPTAAPDAKDKDKGRGGPGGRRGRGDVSRAGLVKAPTDQLPPASLKRLREARLGKPVGAPSPVQVPAPKRLGRAGLQARSAAPDTSVDMRILVLATRGDPRPDGVNAIPAGSWDWNLSTLTDALDYLGTPYDTYLSTTGQLCVNGSWALLYSVDPTAATCTSGRTVSWNGVTSARLQATPTHAHYQGVMQTNGTLSYVTPAGTFVSSALSLEEWTALWTYEAAFGIRTVSANTYPTADFGLTYTGEDASDSTGTWTAAGAAAFPHVNGAGSLPIRNAWTYRASVDPMDTTTVPVLRDAAGRVLGVTHSYPNQGGREALALTFESAGYLTHGQVVGYGLVNWVTKGLFIGERHAYLDPQPDDVFIANDMWSGPFAVCGNRPDDPRLPVYRMTGTDLTRLLTWQRAKQAAPLTAALTLEMPFNGEGTTAAYVADLGIGTDTLTPAARTNQAAFKWVNHTYSHQNLDSLSVPDAQVSTVNGVSTLTTAGVDLSNSWGHAVQGARFAAGTIVVDVTSPGAVVLSQPATSVGAAPDATVGTTEAQAASQLSQNVQVAGQLGLTRFTTENLVQPDISGLTNPAFLRAANQAGVRYLISDTSRTGDPAVNGMNEGRFNAVDPTLLEVTRYPVNLYFNVTTPQQWLAEDNCLYPAGAPFGHVSTYAQLLDRESNVLLRYLLQGHNRPLMFHQPNLRAYSGTKSLLSDLLDATLTKYSRLVTVPLLSPTQDDLGRRQIARQTYNDAWKNGGLSGRLVPGGMTLTAATAVTVPVTGLQAPAPYSSELYGKQRISYIPLTAGQSVTIPVT